MARRPTLLVHGFLDTGYTPWWSLLRRYLESAGLDHVETVTVGSLPGTTVGSPREYAEVVGEAVESIHEQTDEEVNVVAHSMGGLDTRWYLEQMGGDSYVDQLVTLSTPHQGTRLTKLVPFSSGARDMEPSSDFIRTLNTGEPASSVDYTAVWSKLDPAVYPRRRAKLPDRWLDAGGRNVAAGAYSHIEMVARRAVFNKYKAFLLG